MRRSLSVILSILFLTVAIADDKYEKEIKKNLEKIDECRTPNDFIKLANNFERIAVAEKDKWLPYYYSAFVYILASYVDSSNSRKDIYLDKSDKFNNIADSLQPNNSEIYALKGMISQARMQVDPMNRWQKYGAEATNNFTKAMQIDTLNPRPEYLIGVGVFFTPKQFGGGPTAAKPILEKSLAKFEKFVPENEIMPNWGKEQVVEYLKQINEGK
jgi:hypothetical protein